MTNFDQNQVKRLTTVHGWSGVVLGLLLYAVVITGTTIVFKDEIAVWSAGGLTSDAPLSGNIDARVRPLVEGMSKGYHERVSIFADDRGDLIVFPHARVFNPDHGHVEPYGSLFRLDPVTGETLARHEGFVFDEPRTHEASALEDFLYDLHERLHIPGTLGLIVVGSVGLLSMFAGLSGIIMHRHLFRDLFLPERWGERLVVFRDRHVLAGTWSLPFAFLLGFTGAYLCFTGTVVSPLLTQAAFGGDRDRMLKVMFEPKVTPDPSPAEMANLDTMIADVTARSGVPPRFILIDRWGRADARIRTFHAPATGGMNTIRTAYDGVTGEFLGFRAPVGNAPSVGGTLRGLMGPLHFGDFAGVASKSVWVGLGSAMAFVVISGMRLWVRRREDEVLWQRFGRSVTIVGYGLPVAMLSCAYAYFLALGAGADAFWWTPAGFLIGIGPGVLPGLVLSGDEDRLRRLYRALLGVGVVLLPIVRMASGGLDWAAAISQGQGTVLSVDLTLLALGAGLLWWARRPAPAPAPEPVAAE